MRRILHVIQSIDPRGGGPIAAVHQLREADQAHVHEILSLDDPAGDLVRGATVPITAVGPAGILGYSRRLIPWLRRYARDHDLIVIHGLWRFHSFGTWLALYRSGIAYFVCPHGMLDPWFNELYPLKRIKKALFWSWTEYRVLRDAKAVLFTCEAERERSRHAFRPYGCRETVIPLGIASPQGDRKALRGAFFAAFPELEDRRLLLFLSRIHRKKGCDLLIKAFARHAACDDRLHLVMAGPDQVGWSAQLKQQAKRLGIADRISWPGMLSGDLKWGAYHAAEAFILPSHHENFGIVVVEALACGTPVLISDRVQIWREIDAAGAGFAEHDDLAGTRRLIERWLALSAAERQTYAKRAQACFLNTFHAKEFAARWHTLVDERLDPSGSAAAPPASVESARSPSSVSLAK